MNEFNPDWNVHPGASLEEFLEIDEMTHYECARRMGVATRTVTDIVEGRIGITPEIAEKLATVFHWSSGMWLRLQANYDERENLLR